MTPVQPSSEPQATGQIVNPPLGSDEEYLQLIKSQLAEQKADRKSLRQMEELGLQTLQARYEDMKIRSAKAFATLVESTAEFERPAAQMKYSIRPRTEDSPQPPTENSPTSIRHPISVEGSTKIMVDGKEQEISYTTKVYADGIITVSCPAFEGGREVSFAEVMLLARNKGERFALARFLEERLEQVVVGLEHGVKATTKSISEAVEQHGIKNLRIQLNVLSTKEKLDYLLNKRA